jgi:predicted RNA-binding protein with RPS1 domain
MSSYLDDISSPDSAPDQALEASVPPAVAAADDSDASPSASHALERPAGPDATKAKRPKRASKPAPTADMVGATLTGTVRTVMPYGAFVDVGRSSDGLVHISRVRDDFVADVAEVLSVGDEVSVRVISVDLDKKQIALSMLSEESEAAAAATRGQGKRRPQRSGGDRAAQGKALAALAGSGYSDELFVEGSVVSTLPFGAFVRFSTKSLVGTLEGELDGLVHISALSKDRVDSVEAVCNVGDSVKVRVKDVDVEGGKISLSMINKEDEPAPRRGGGGAGGKRGPRIEERFTESEMGAKDWKESMEEFNTSQGTFSNNLMMKKTN